MGSFELRHVDFVAGVERLHADWLARRLKEARELGLSSIDELEAFEAEQEKDAAAATRASDERRRRERACDAAHGRITPEMRSKIEMGAELSPTPALAAVSAWLGPKQRPMLILAGGTGCGKTVASVHAMIECRSRVQFVRAMRIGSHFERWSSDREDKVPPLDLGVGLLVVDDLGQESLDDRRSMPALEEIVDARQGPDTRTIFTTNLTREQITARYSERIRSRLTQSAHWCPIAGVDLRRKQGASDEP